MTVVRLAATPPAPGRADLVVVAACGAAHLAAALQEFPLAARTRLRADLARHRFSPSRGQECLVHAPDGSAGNVLFVGGSSPPGVSFWYEVADATVQHALRTRARHTVVALPPYDEVATVQAVAEGIALARYSFTRYRSSPGRPLSPPITLAVRHVDAARRAAVRGAQITARATALARDLTNTPAADLGPRDLAAAARRVAGNGLRVRVFDQRALARLGMGAILGVGRGSSQPPRFVEMIYRPARARGCVALVGKGITFDSGGLSLKTADAMQAQKRDMAGAAAVLSVMSALPALQLPLEVRGYLASAENMPSGNAVRPGDVVRAYNGTTIEVLNTDAEGRLVLADGLSYAARRRPDCIIDLATLTAVVRTALGPRCAAVLGTDRRLIRELTAAATEANEMLWELPLIEDYRRDIDSRIADLKNVGEGHAGTIVAALFLREFVGEVPWAHIDFSSTVMSEGLACHPKGASGFGVRTLLRWLARLAAGQPAKRPAAARRGTTRRPARRA